MPGRLVRLIRNTPYSLLQNTGEAFQRCEQTISRVSSFFANAAPKPKLYVRQLSCGHLLALVGPDKLRLLQNVRLDLRLYFLASCSFAKTRMPLVQRI